MRPNNPRAVAESVSLAAWREPYSESDGTANLFIDVQFLVGLVGAEPDLPVRFKFRLRRAQIKVMRDREEIIEILPETVMRQALATLTKEKVESTTYEGGISGAAKLAKLKLDLSADVGGSAAVQMTETVRGNEEVFPIVFQHFHREDCVGFEVTAQRVGRPLQGAPWEPNSPQMKIRDKKHGRTRGEEPELKVILECRQQDLLIEDVEFKDKKIRFDVLGREKQVVVLQALKTEIMRTGLSAGDLSEPLASLVLADVVTGQMNV